MPLPIGKRYFDDTGHCVEALGAWDHGLEPYDIGDQAEEPKIETVQVRSILLT